MFLDWNLDTFHLGTAFIFLVKSNSLYRWSGNEDQLYYVFIWHINRQAKNIYHAFISYISQTQSCGKEV